MLPNEVDILIFLSTPSARRATGGLAFAAINDKISIHALREEGDIQFFFDRTKAAFISIHALREEGDLHPRCNPGGWSAISIHALREEGDANVAKQRVDLFISIHALREEGDGLLLSSIRKPRNFYPRPPRGGRHKLNEYLSGKSEFLSTPSARRATRTVSAYISAMIFLSTPSARRATSGW